MTRINCVPVAELTDAHLGAEYRELPRVFALAQAAYERGEDPTTYPQEYLLGAGHVKFFYARLGYLRERYAALAAECARRGRRVSYPDVPVVDLPCRWKQDWQPTPAALALNRGRIAERLGARP